MHKATDSRTFSMQCPKCETTFSKTGKDLRTSAVVYCSNCWQPFVTTEAKALIKKIEAKSASKRQSQSRTAPVAGILGSVHQSWNS